MCSLVSPLGSRTSRSSSGWKCTVCPRSQPAGRGRGRGSCSLGRAVEPAVPLGFNRLPRFLKRFAVISKPSTPTASLALAPCAQRLAGSALGYLPQCGRAAVLGALPATRLLAETRPPQSGLPQAVVGGRACRIPPETSAEGVSVGVTGGSSASSLVSCWVLAQCSVRWSLPEQWTSQEPPLFSQEYWV